MVPTYQVDLYIYSFHYDAGHPVMKSWIQSLNLSTDETSIVSASGTHTAQNIFKM